MKGDVPIRKEKIYLQSRIQSHPIVKSKDFWESCAFESILSELQVKQKRYLEKKEIFDHIKDKYIIFGQLSSVSHNMLIYNYDKREIKDIIGRYARFFTLPEDLLNDLMFTVENYIQIQPKSNSSIENYSHSEGMNVNLLRDLGLFLKI